MTQLSHRGDRRLSSRFYRASARIVGNLGRAATRLFRRNHSELSVVRSRGLEMGTESVDASGNGKPDQGV